VDDYIVDPWTAINYKAPMVGGVPLGMPSWVGDHGRRLTAYDVLQSYFDNNARRFITPPDADDIVAGREPEDHREYGDASIIVKTILAGLLGHDQVIVVDGAELLKKPTESEPSPGNDPEVVRADALQTYLREWAKKERFGLKLIESERNAIALGDGVYAVGWSSAQNRPTLMCVPPSFYFPVLGDDLDEQFPEKVHLAWELPPDKDSPSEIKIRRITYELVEDDPEEVPAHSYPYAPGKLTYTRCLMSDGVWTINSGTATVDDLTEQRVKWQKNDEGEVIRNLDIGVDFIPVVHVPNTVAELDHYGQSSLVTVLQILDDLAAADTDIQRASATTGTPVISISGATAGPETLTYGPGTVFSTGDGKMDMLDTSRSLDALLKLVSSLLTRLSVNSRVPEAALGRIDAAKVPSGIALALSFSPLEQMVEEMRAVRNEKYPLLLSFVLKFAMANGVAPIGDVPDCAILFGNFLPTDKESVVKMVQQLMGVNAISILTAILMLQEAGFPIEDAAAEVERIKHEMLTQKAYQVAQATGSFKNGADYLGLTEHGPDGPGVSKAPAVGTGSPGPAGGTPSNNPSGFGTG
jgi:hypothetical protein